MKTKLKARSKKSVGKIVAQAALNIDRFGDGLEFEPRTAGDEIVLFPANGNSATLTVTLQYENGQPAPGQPVRGESTPLTIGAIALAGCRG